MIRHAAGFLVVALLCSQAGAENPPKLTALQQQQLFQKNRQLIQTLVDGSVEMSNVSNDYTQRSRVYRRMILEFQKELTTAADQNDPNRVVEIGKHLDTVMRQGLAPTLKVARGRLGPDGTGMNDLIDMRDRSVELADWLQNKSRAQWKDNPQVQEVIDSLEKTKKELGGSIAP